MRLLYRVVACVRVVCGALCGPRLPDCVVGQARDLKPSAIAGKSDPYVKVKIGAMEKITKVVNNAANNPAYDETFSFSISTEKEVAVRGVCMCAWYCHPVRAWAYGCWAWCVRGFAR